MHHVSDMSPATAEPVRSLTRRRKAAIIVQLMLGDGNKITLTDLPEHLQEDLAGELASIRLVDRDTVNAVAQEFMDLLEAIGLSAPGDPSAALDALSDLISPQLLARLRDKLATGGRVDAWIGLQNLDDDVVKRILLDEDLQIGAVLLSKLPVSRAATLLTTLPGDRSRRLAMAIKDTADINPDTVTRIGHALLSSYGKTRSLAFAKPPSDRMGDILNSATSSTRNAMLTDLEGADSDYARDVRQAIFTFEDITTRLEPTDIPTSLRDVDQKDLATAMAYALGSDGAAKVAADFILNSLSQRMAGQIRDAAEDIGTPTDDAGEAALTAVSSAIREQVDAGTIVLRQLDDTD